jgi:hypothetical protein
VAREHREYAIRSPSPGKRCVPVSAMRVRCSRGRARTHRTESMSAW